MNRIILLLTFLGCIAFQANAQKPKGSFTVTGTVIDEFDGAVPGATVFLKDRPGAGTVTDVDGKFTIKAADYDVLIVSFLGYEKYEHRITKSEHLDIKLQASSVQLDEAVVVGMGSQRKVSVVGAITSVKTKDLNVPATNMSNVLGGRVPGIISIQSSGEPGRNISDFWIRGIGTFGANSKALVLVDGLEGNLSEIDPADVESFSVLKDASATAVYGSRGANGVVIITTKRGIEQKLKITARANWTISQLKRLPKYLRAYQYASLANEANVVSGNTALYSPMEMDIIKYGLDTDMYPDVDWQDEILNKTSLQQTYYVNAQGGGSVARYFLSMGMSDESSAYKPSDDSKYNKGVGYKTYTYRMNLDMDFTKTTSVFFGVDGFISVNNKPGLGKDISDDNTTKVIWDSQAKTTPLLYPQRFSTGELPAYGDGKNSNIPPHVLLNYTGSAKDKENRTLATLGINQDLSMITKGLKAKIQGSWDNRSTFRENRFKSPALYAGIGRDDNGKLRLFKVQEEQAVKYTDKTKTWEKLYLDANINYERLFAEKHRVSGLLFYYMESTSESGNTVSLDALPKRYQSLSGRATYAFKDTYFIDGNFGFNGSENFKPGEQFGFFPAGAVGWVPTAYNWVQQNAKWLNFLKFRFSYGSVGNDRIADTRFPYLTMMKETDDQSAWGGIGTLDEERVGADNLQWEKAIKSDFGIEARMFDEKFNFNLDFFWDKREGIFQQRELIPAYIGAVSMPFGNVGSMKSWGSDGNFEYIQPLGKDSYLTVRGNFTLSKNKVLSWEEPQTRFPYLAKSGYGHEVQRGLIALGLFKDEDDIASSPAQFGILRPGDIKYKDVTGDGKITDDDKVPLFSNQGMPNLMYGVGAEYTYKNLTVNILFKGTGHNRFLYDTGDGYIPFSSGVQGNVLDMVWNQKNRWTPASYSGDPATENPNARFPRLTYGRNDNNNRESTFWKGDAIYLRLQELSVKYNLQIPAIRKMLGVQSIDIQLMGENLFVWDKVKTFDPEQASKVGKEYPIPARYSLQLYVNF